MTEINARICYINEVNKTLFVDCINKFYFGEERPFGLLV